MQKRSIAFAIAVLAFPRWSSRRKPATTTRRPRTSPASRPTRIKDGTKVGQQLIDDRIVAAIDTQLADEGADEGRSEPGPVRRLSRRLRQAEGHLHLQLRYGGGYGAYGWGWGGGWAGGSTHTQVRDILVGTLVIDIADAKKGQLAWRGMGVKEVNTQANPEKRDKSINNAVKKIFKNYPPKVKT